MQIALPIALQKSDELKPYIDAKNRLEERYKKKSVEIGAFFYQHRDMTTAQVEKAILNSEQVCVISTQLDYTKDLLADNADTLRRSVFMSSSLKNKSERLSVDFHVGVQATDEPGVSTLHKNYDKTFAAIASSIGVLADEAKARGVGLTVENSPPVTMEPQAKYMSFTTLEDLKRLRKEVGRRNVGVTFDVAVYALMNVLHASEWEEIKQITALANSCASWEEFTDAYGTYKDWLREATEFHISNSTGLTCHVPGSREAKQFGEMGTTEGGLTREDLLLAMKAADEKRAVCSIEVTLDLKNLTYIEVDGFLKFLWG